MSSIRVGGARDEILALVRAANDGASAPPIPRAYRRTGERPHEELIALFCERVDAYGAEVERVRAELLPAAIGAAARRHGARRLVLPSGLAAELRGPELETVIDDALTARELDRVDGVISGCTLAIAETGTIVLTGGAREGRRLLSLVPDRHICIVSEDQIVETVPEAITRLGQITRTDRRPVTLISGPSATSDIELQRVEGVHGPRTLVVLVVGAGTA